jgi:hypothetical protein
MALYCHLSVPPLYFYYLCFYEIICPITKASSYQNIRLIGTGTIDGSGWKLAETITDELGKQLPVYAKANASTVSELGILAANQVAAAGGGSAGYNTRSPLLLIAKVTNLYIAQVKFINPSKDTTKIQTSANLVRQMMAFKMGWQFFWQKHNANNPIFFLFFSVSAKKHLFL